MRQPIAKLSQLLGSLKPKLNEGVYAYCSLAKNQAMPSTRILAYFREEEGSTLILEESDAQKEGLHILFRSAWITLTVHSALSAIGLTAAVSSTLADNNIPCNVVAAAHHDHLFVPVEKAHQAMAFLQQLQQNSGPHLN